jgi:hypothetical protein
MWLVCFRVCFQFELFGYAGSFYDEYGSQTLTRPEASFYAKVQACPLNMKQSLTSLPGSHFVAAVLFLGTGPIVNRAFRKIKINPISKST